MSDLWYRVTILRNDGIELMGKVLGKTPLSELAVAVHSIDCIVIASPMESDDE